MIRRAKIVCTLGPATESAERIDELVRSGMDVARLNLSHGKYADHEVVYRRVRASADASGRAVGVLADLQGPKVRLGTFSAGPVMLRTGAAFEITTRDVDGTAERASTTYAGLPGDLGTGDRVLVDDGRVVLQVERVDGDSVHARVVEGGPVSDHKGLNVPGAALSVPALGEKDVEDLRWALALGVDLVALSFVRSPSDADKVREVMAEVGRTVPIVAKIEKPQAVERLDEVVEAFDAIMVARGDLGVELPLEQVPIVQKRAIALARSRAKPVIVATQMLESMVSASRPTRAEVSDCANGVLDGADALMLSAETSVGQHPVEAVSTMRRIIANVEDQALDTLPPIGARPRTKGGVIGRAAAEVGEELGARFLVAFTQSGDSARRLARYRSSIPLLAFTPVQATRSQLSLTWGVETFIVPEVSHTDEMVRQVDAVLVNLDRCHAGDLVVIVAGSPPGIAGSTNALRVHRIGDAVGGVAPAYA